MVPQHTLHDIHLFETHSEHNVRLINFQFFKFVAHTFLDI